MMYGFFVGLSRFSNQVDILYVSYEHTVFAVFYGLINYPIIFSYVSNMCLIDMERFCIAILILYLR